jgi:DNA polymerase III gamma/tau subunit
VDAFYRKYCPQDFEEVVGQEAVVRTVRRPAKEPPIRAVRWPDGE